LILESFKSDIGFETAIITFSNGHLHDLIVRIRNSTRINTDLDGFAQIKSARIRLIRVNPRAIFQ
jgi:hypothetical protein